MPSTGGRTAASCVWKASVSGLSRFTVAPTWNCRWSAARAEGLGDRVGQQRVRADLDEVAVVGAGRGTAWLNRTGLRRLAAQ